MLYGKRNFYNYLLLNFIIFNFSLYSSNLEDDGFHLLFESISSLKNLTSLDIGDCRLTDKSIDCINSLIYVDDKNNWAGSLLFLNLFKICIFLPI